MEKSTIGLVNFAFGAKRPKTEQEKADLLAKSRTYTENWHKNTDAIDKIEDTRKTGVFTPEMATQLAVLRKKRDELLQEGFSLAHQR